MPEYFNRVMAQNNTFLSHIQLVLHYSSMKYASQKRLNEWSQQFPAITVLAPEKPSFELPGQVQWKCHHPEAFKADAWNAEIEQTDKEWILFIEDDEELSFSDFPKEDEIGAGRWVPALIQYHQQEKTHLHYQIRLVHTEAGKVFQGKNLPDCTRYITENEIELSAIPLQLIRSDNPLQNIDADEELGTVAYAPQTYLVEGQRNYQAGNYVQAASQYRQVLKIERLLPFDRLAAVNGLASCLAEQFKWDKALGLAKQSRDAEPFQNLPYLIEYRIHQLQSEWQKAYDALNRYHEGTELFTRANFDLNLSEEETVLTLADLALKIGNRKKASDHLNDFFELKDGDVEPSFLKKLLLLCIELKEKGKAEFFFKKYFDGAFPGKMEPQQQTELQDFMTLFMKNEWFEFVYDTYNELHERHPENDEYKRRLIVVSVKTDRLAQARQLAAKVA